MVSPIWLLMVIKQPNKAHAPMAAREIGACKTKMATIASDLRQGRHNTVRCLTTDVTTAAPDGMALMPGRKQRLHVIRGHQSNQYLRVAD